MSDTDTITLTREQLDAAINDAVSKATSSRAPSWVRSAGRYVGARLAEPSTYAGITLAATAFGAHLDPEKSQAISQLGVLMAGGILAALRDPGSSA